MREYSKVNPAAIVQAFHLKKVGQTAHEGPCPRCSGNDRFWVNTAGEGKFGCRGCGSEPGFYEAVIRAAGLWEDRDDEYAPPPPPRKNTSHTCTRLCGRYQITDGSGWITNHRSDDVGGKRCWREPSGKTPRTLVRIYAQERDSLDALPIVICEGEKAAWAAHDAGLVSASWLGGTAGVGLADFSPIGRRDVVLWPDNDGPGQKAMVQVAAKVKDCGATSIRIVNISGMVSGGDAADVPQEVVRARVEAATEFVEAPPLVASGTEFVDTPDDVLDRMIRRNSHRLLLVSITNDTMELRVNLGTGIWRQLPSIVEQWLVESEDVSTAALDTEYDPKMARLAALSRRRIRSERYRQQVLSGLLRLYGWYQENGFPAELTVADITEIDSDTRYLGAPNGVIDLQTARILPPAEGAATLTTMSIPDNYLPSAVSKDIDQMLGRLPPEDVGWLLAALGYALRGWPSRRIYLLLGKAGGGKSTLAAALKAALGTDYCRELADGTLTQNRSSGDGAPRPELGILTSSRIAIVEEPGGSLSVPVIKKVTGDGAAVWRPLYSNEIMERRITATIIMASNPESMPAIDMLDSGVRERFRVLPYAPIPDGERDAALRWRVVERPARQALVAMLVKTAAQTTRPPEDIPTVAVAREMFSQDSLGEAGEWLSGAIVPDPNGRITGTALWHAAQTASGDTVGGSRAWGMTRGGFTKLARRIHSLPPTKSIRDAGGTVGKGWVGWRLLTDTEQEAAASVLQEVLSDIAFEPKSDVIDPYEGADVPAYYDPPEENEVRTNFNSPCEYPRCYAAGVCEMGTSYQEIFCPEVPIGDE